MNIWFERRQFVENFADVQRRQRSDVISQKNEDQCTLILVLHHSVRAFIPGCQSGQIMNLSDIASVIRFGNFRIP